MGNQGNNAFQVTWKVRQKRRRVSLLFFVDWMENPGGGIVIEALSNDPKGNGDPVHFLRHTEICPIFQRAGSFKLSFKTTY